MALLPPGASSGDGTVVDHNDLAGRDAPNGHPVTAITGLQDWQEQQDRALATALSLRQTYTFSNTTSQEITLPAPSDTLSFAVVLTRTSDGAVIEPGLTYLYGPGPMRYLTGVRMSFNPPLVGEHVVHIVR